MSRLIWQRIQKLTQGYKDKYISNDYDMAATQKTTDCCLQSLRPACTSVQSDQHHCYSLHSKYGIYTCFIYNFNILSRLSEQTGLKSSLSEQTGLNICLFGLMLNAPVKSYGHVGTVSSPNHTFFPGQASLSG